jgi:hypothetical protein
MASKFGLEKCSKFCWLADTLRRTAFHVQQRPDTIKVNLHQTWCEDETCIYAVDTV